MQAVAQRPGGKPETVCLQGLRWRPRHGAEAHTLDSKILETFALNLVSPFPGPCTLSLFLGAALLTFIVRGVHPAPKMGYS